MDFSDKTVSLIGYGVSNRALLTYLLDKGIVPLVRCKEECPLPKGVRGIFSPDYYLATEDVVFRSPGVRPDKIKTRGTVLTEASFALSLAKCHKIGITGSDGKTTTSTLVYQILKEHGKMAFLGGNIGNALVSLLPYLCPESFLVSELSSFQLIDMTPSLDVAIITNVSENHLDWHTSLLEYTLAKGNILKHASRAVLPYEHLRSLYSADTVTYFSLLDLSSMTFLDSAVYLKNGYIYYNSEPIIARDEVKMRGEFNLLNLMAAIGATYPFVSREAICKVAGEFSFVPSRMETLDTVNGVTFVSSPIDTTPTRTVSTLSAFENEKTVLILGGYDKNLSYAPLKNATRGMRAIVITGQNREKIYESVFGSCDTILFAENLEGATHLAYECAKQGDTVLLSPASASFDAFKNYKEKGAVYLSAVKEIKNEQG